MLGIVDERGLHPAAAGAVAASVWSLLEPIDRRLFGSDYSDVLLLGKTFTRGRLAWPLGFAIHAANGAAFGLAYEAAARITGWNRERLAVGMALGEHLALFPLGAFSDRYHPARGEPDMPPIGRSPKAFAQATWRHYLFGRVLGRLA